MTPTSRIPASPGLVDLDLCAETALAVAQSTIQNAIDSAGITRAELAQRMGCSRSFVTRILQGDHNLTIKTLAKALGACGQEVAFESTSPRCVWVVDQEQAPAISMRDEADADENPLAA
jgi:transcriptional regulator with XRE-family HTH domain